MRIVMNNARSRIEAPQNVIDWLRPQIAFRAQNLPPVAVQKLIKGFMARPADAYERRRMENGESYRTAPRQGPERDLAAFVHYKGAELANLGGWDARLTSSQFEGALRLRGFWDGWESLMTSGGWFGTGLVPYVERAITLHMRSRVEIVDERGERPWPTEDWIRFRPPLYRFQHEAIIAWTNAGFRGVIDAPPRSGKTRIAMGAISALGLPTLIVVPRVNLVKQTVAAFEEFFPKGSVVGITGGKPNRKLRARMNGALVWVATPPTAAGPKDKDGRRKGIDGILSRRILIIDEFHHAAASTYQAISEAATRCYYRLGLTGTHYRADGKDLAMHAVLSRRCYSRSVEDMVDAGRLVPARVAMVRVPPVQEAPEGRLYTWGVTDHTRRNETLAWAAHALASAGKRVLVITKEVDHARTLGGMIPGAVQVDGSTPERSAMVRPALADLESGKVRCVVGTSVIGEGVDVPRADALVYAAGGRSKVKVVQDFFRVLTAAHGKDHGIVIDAADNHHAGLVQSAAHRLALYRRAFDTTVVDPHELPAWVDSAVRGT